MGLALLLSAISVSFYLHSAASQATSRRSYILGAIGIYALTFGITLTSILLINEHQNSPIEIKEQAND